MTEQELRRLSRSDLLELLLAQRKENEQLRCMLDQAEARLTDRTIQINKADPLRMPLFSLAAFLMQLRMPASITWTIYSS